MSLRMPNLWGHIQGSYMKKLVIVAGIIGVIVIGGFFTAQHFLEKGITIKISAAQINKVVKPKFPRTKKSIFHELVLSNPHISFLSKENKIQCKVDTKFKFLFGGVTTKGKTVAAGRVAYDAKRGHIYIKDVQIKDIQLEGVSSNDLLVIKPIISNLMKATLNNLPVYKLDPNNKKHALAKKNLRSIEVKGNKLVVTLGKP